MDNITLEHPVPDNIETVKELPLVSLTKKVANKTATLGIVGLGYVGLPLSIASCANGIKTIGFDISTNKIESLKNGHSYITGVSSDKIKQNIENNLFYPTDDLQLLKNADFILLCVPTPLTANHTPDMDYIIKSCEMVKEILRPGHVIILESTTYPGTTNDLIVPILEKSGLTCGYDFFVAYSPEREDPGNKDFSTHTIPKVVGADDPKILDITAKFYENFISKVVRVNSTKAAEAVKLLENIFRCVNIGLINELKQIFDHMDIDIYEVIDAAKTKPFGFMPFYPGPGIGGHCIPIDPLYLSWKSNEYKTSTKFINVATEVNQKMPEYVVRQFSEELNDQAAKSLNGSKILVVGLAYKKNVSDLRESPAADIIRILQKRKASVCYYDPHIDKIPDNDPDYKNISKINWTKEELSKVDGAIIVTDHDGIDWKLLIENTLVYDTRGVIRKLDFDSST